MFLKVSVGEDADEAGDSSNSLRSSGAKNGASSDGSHSHQLVDGATLVDALVDEVVEVLMVAARAAARAASIAAATTWRVIALRVKAGRAEARARSRKELGHRIVAVVVGRLHLGNRSLMLRDSGGCDVIVVVSLGIAGVIALMLLQVPRGHSSRLGNTVVVDSFRQGEVEEEAATSKKLKLRKKLMKRPLQDSLSKLGSVWSELMTKGRRSAKKARSSWTPAR